MIATALIFKYIVYKLCGIDWYICWIYFQVRLLLEFRANPTVSNKLHKTPLDLACEFGRFKVKNWKNERKEKRKKRKERDRKIQNLEYLCMVLCTNVF